MTITNRDKELLNRAESLHYTEWYEAEALANQAHSPTVREEIRRIGTRLYHTEEFYAEML